MSLNNSPGNTKLVSYMRNWPLGDMDTSSLIPNLPIAATSGRVGRERVSREVGRDQRPQGTEVLEAVLFRDTRDVNSELEGKWRGWE